MSVAVYNSITIAAERQDPAREQLQNVPTVVIFLLVAQEFWAQHEHVEAKSDVSSKNPFFKVRTFSAVDNI